jgi:hypothetical protein
MRKSILIAGMFIFLHCPISYANNIAVSDVIITGQDATAKTSKIQFSVSWENSWRSYVNYDAAWVFVKYSTDEGATWSHATMKTTGGGVNPQDFSRGTATVGGVSKNLDIVVPSDNKGALIQIASTNNGSGPLSATGLQLVWDWGSDKLSSDGITAISSATIARVKVFAIEMVYIPQGTYRNILFHQDDDKYRGRHDLAFGKSCVRGVSKKPDHALQRILAQRLRRFLHHEVRDLSGAVRRFIQYSYFSSKDDQGHNGRRL